MKKEVLIFIFDGYIDWEIAYIAPELNSCAKYAVKTVALDKKVKISAGGLKVVPDYTVKNIPQKPAMLILPGGSAWLSGKNDKIKETAAFYMKKNIPVAAICDGVTFMAGNGHLDSVNHTGNSLEYLLKKAPEYKGRKKYLKYQAVSDGNVITANGTAALEFAAEIFLKLKAKTEEGTGIWYSFFKKGYYKT